MEQGFFSLYIFKKLKFLPTKITRMNIKTFVTNTKKAINTPKFDSLKYSSNGLLLKYRNKPEIEIPFAHLEKIYIKKHKLNPFVEFVGIAFPFLLVYMSIQYLPLALMILVSLVAIFFVFMVVINLKWYQLYVCLHDGTSFRKKISLKKKTENFAILEKVRAEHVKYTFNENGLAST